ncbi:WD and tetratricopeptide repeats protein 1 [Porphyridium purpureum]|uniref:WD and tetratricopeptide repeats protein 1 n=1 Tax=Porphyridium purpureum TaxID=35688 RepID=A0A5J4YPC7_PORPP|nr:WD and tetratricopeptide repeats protein 1 [Porphyridium purpureum]|eukprot:POR6511..scf249_10
MSCTNLVVALEERRRWGRHGQSGVETGGRILGHPALGARFDMERKLDAHDGCVNRLSWSECGTFLLSGSDDLTLCIWNPSLPVDARLAKEKAGDPAALVHRVSTAHVANIFGVRFLPCTNSQVLVSGGMDANVCVTDIRAPEAPRVFAVHKNRVKTVEVEPLNPHLVFSAGEDGRLFQIDLRKGSLREPLGADILLESGSARVAFKCAAINPVRVNEILVASSDEYLRLYDRRMMDNTNGHENRTMQQMVHTTFAPKHMQLSRYFYDEPFVTHAAFSADGRQIVANYSNDYVYTFDNTGTSTDAASNRAKRPVRTGGKSAHSIRRASTSRTRTALERGHEHAKHARWARAAEVLGPATTTCHIGSAQGEVLECCVLSAQALALRAYALRERKWYGDVRLGLADVQNVLDWCASASSCSCTPPPWLPKMQAIMSWLKLELVVELCFGYSDSSRLPRRSSQWKELQQRLASGLACFLPDVQLSVDKLGLDETDLCGLNPFWQNVCAAIPDSMKRTAERIRAQAPSKTEPDSLDATVPANNDRNSLKELWKLLGDLKQVGYRSRFTGATNFATDIKEASFLGEHGELVLAGSDDGRLYVWDNCSNPSRLLCALQADSDVLNCVQAHPSQTLVATSGIEDTIRLWTPCAEAPQSRTELDEIVDEHFSESAEFEMDSFGIPLPMFVLQRLAASMDTSMHDVAS